MSITLPQAYAAGRHALTFASGAVMALASFHLISSGDAASATDAVSQIGDGVAKIAAGVTTLVGIGSGVYAAWTASPFRQLLSVASNPAVTKIVAPSISASVPSNKVVAN